MTTGASSGASRAPTPSATACSSSRRTEAGRPACTRSSSPSTTTGSSSCRSGCAEPTSDVTGRHDGRGPENPHRHRRRVGVRRGGPGTAVPPQLGRLSQRPFPRRPRGRVTLESHQFRPSRLVLRPGRFQSRPKPRGSSTSRASRSTSQTPSRSSAVLDSARVSGSWSRQVSYSACRVRSSARAAAHRAGRGFGLGGRNGGGLQGCLAGASSSRRQSTSARSPHSGASQPRREARRSRRRGGRARGRPPATRCRGRDRRGPGPSVPRPGVEAELELVVRRAPDG